jgi:NADPH:quinone reductase-like Zn-dependent oxidoreductase
MRAVVLLEFGKPVKLKVEEIATPEPGEGEILVAVKAAGINPSDVKNVEGAMHGTTLPRVPGRDFAGTVVRGPARLMNQEVWGTGGDIGFTRDGSHAEYILLPAAAVVARPKALAVEAAGSAGLVFVTAWSALITAAQVNAGDTVLVIGAAGGVGSAAVQIAKWKQARVLAAVRDEKELERARGGGADEVINTADVRLVDAVRSMSSGGPNVVFDTTGKMFAESIECAAPDGRLPIITAPPDGKVTFNLRGLYRKTLRVLGVDTRQIDAVASAKLLGEMNAQFESGAFKASAGQAFDLSAAADAYEKSASGGQRVYLTMER